MTGELLIRALRRHGWLYVPITLICLVAGYFGVHSLPKKYTASAQAFVAVSSGAGSLSSTAGGLQALYAGGLFTEDRVQSYIEMIRTEAVASAAIQRYGVRGLSPSALVNEMSVSAPANTVLITINVTDRLASRAAQAANAVALAFIQFDRQLEGGPSGKAPVKISLSQPATVPTAPSSPRKTLDLALAGLIGLLLSTGLVVAVENGDRRLRTVDQLTELAKLPVLATIPLQRRLSSAGALFESSERSLQAESYRHLRTNLQFIDVDNPPRVILVTSPHAGDGKTTIACNVAAVYADAGFNVLIVDADLRAPRVADYLQCDSMPGLTEAIVATDDDAASRMIQQSPSRASLHVLTSGQQPLAPSELLASGRAAEFLAALRTQYDVIVIDSPPVLPVTDASVLSPNVDVVVLVTRAGATTVAGIRSALTTMAAVGARVVGVVFNGAPERAMSSYSAYYGEYASTGTADDPKS